MQKQKSLIELIQEFIKKGFTSKKATQLALELTKSNDNHTQGDSNGKRRNQRN